LVSRTASAITPARRVCSPPVMASDWTTLLPGATLVVLNAIVAYESLFTDRTYSAIQCLLDAAERDDVPIVFTRWCRLRPETPTSAIDRKGS
jgi:hypothetical protein